jgi:hypothetical protein
MSKVVLSHRMILNLGSAFKDPSLGTEEGVPWRHVALFPHRGKCSIMRKTQIQLPQALYQRLKSLAAGMVPGGDPAPLRRTVPDDPAGRRTPGIPLDPPPARHGGEFLCDVKEWTELAHGD